MKVKEKMKQIITNTKRRSIAEINVVPYVDVMLVLLVIFMVTAPLITQGVTVELPEASAKVLPQDDSNMPVVVTVDSKGTLYLSISADPDKEIHPNMLLAEVKAAVTRNPKRQVIVKGDKRVSYDYVMQAMVLLQQAGVASVGLETKDIGLLAKEDHGSK